MQRDAGNHLRRRQTTTGDHKADGEEEEVTSWRSRFPEKQLVPVRATGGLGELRAVKCVTLRIAALRTLCMAGWLCVVDFAYQEKINSVALQKSGQLKVRRF